MNLLSAEVLWHLQPGRQPLPSVLTWHREAPLELAVDFGVPGLVRTWVFARDLLDDALRLGHAGEGDVKIRLLAASYVHLALSSHDGSCEMTAHGGPLAVFLRQTYAEVPRGSERYDVDAVLAGIDRWARGTAA